MALKAIVDDIGNVDESLRDHYEEQDGKYILKLDGVREHPEVTALRGAYDAEKQKRRDIAAERDKLKERLSALPDDFDPDEFERLKANGDGGEDLHKKIEEARAREAKRWERKVADLTSERDDLRQKYSGTRTETALKDALNEVNIAPHLRKAAEKLWKTDTTLDEDGNIVTKDGTPLSDAVKEWAQTDEGRHFVAAPANGGGGAPGGRSGGGKTPNPWKADSKNLTEQMRLTKEEPEKAARLKAEAGAA